MVYPEKMADNDMDTKWEEYKKEYQKSYEPEEDKMRRGLFEATLIKIETHNREASEGKHSWTMGINQFTDMRPEEVCCGGFRACRSKKEEQEEQ